MKNQKKSASEIALLRQQAEKQLKSTVPILPPSKTEIQKIIHELEVQQVELEKQLEELALIKKQLAETLAQKDVIDEITEHKQAEELHENEIRFRKLLQDVQSVSVQGYAPDGTTQYWNQASERLYGYTAEEAIGKNLVDLIIPPEMRSDVQQAILQMAETGQPIPSSELSLMHKDGSRVSVFSSHTIVQLPGFAQELFCIDIDLTERKKAEQTLSESEKRYRMLFENTLTGILITRPDGAILAANREACRLLGRTETDICQIGRDGVVDLTNPNLSIALEKRQQTGHFHGELSFVRADGTVFPVEIESGIFNDSNGQTHAYNFFQDITERKQAEDALRESEANIQAIFNASGDSIFLISADETLLAMNEIAARRIGHAKEKLIGQKIADCLPAEVVARRRPFFAHALQTGEIVRFEDERNGCSLSNNLFPVLDVEGNVIRLAVYSSDITERKRAEEAQRQSQIFLNSIIENSPNMLWISDENGTLIRMNQACRDHLQIQDSEVVGIYNILDDNLLKEQGLMPLVKAVFEKGTSVRFETSYDTAAIKGVKLERTTQIFLDINISPILNDQGKVTNAIIQELDITERKRAEEALLKIKRQYDDLVAKIPVGVYILHTKPDGAFALDYASPRMGEMLSLSVESLLADSQTIFKAIHPDDVDGFRTLSQDGIYKHRPFNWKGRIVADGTVKWMHFTSKPEKLENGDTLWHGLIVDITERVNAEQEISLKNEELSNLIAEKDRFFAILAHDLRSPFNVLLGLTLLLDEDLPNLNPNDTRRMVTALRGTALNVFNLLENLLEWSRIKRGNTSFDPKSFVLEPKMDEFLQPVLDLANKKGIEINYSVPDELVVFADQNMLGSIIRNLVSNAIKFTPQNGNVILSAYATGDRNIEISVNDSGIGMNKSIIDKLFNIDRNNNRRGTDGESSSGLGLIICKELVEKHGGKIWVKSQVDKGSTFYLTLPY